MSNLRKRPVTEDIRERSEQTKKTTKLPTSPKPKKNLCWNICKFFFYLIVGTVLFLYLFNMYMVSVEAKKYLKPPVGRMVKLGKGHSLFLNCEGKKNPNKPVVVLVMGFMMCDVGWYNTQKNLVKDGWEVCSYDRSGIGWSEPDPDQFVTVEGFVKELHELIEVSEISKNPGGYVLVGLSMGASITSRYIEYWPTEPKGGYIIDPPLDYTGSGIPSSFENLRTMNKVIQILAEYGFLRPLWYLGKFHPLSMFLGGLPSEISDSYLYLAAKSKGYYYGMIHEMGILDPGHGHFSNESTFKYIAKHDKTPVQVELRVGPFMHGNNMLEDWPTSRQKLKVILGDKQHSFVEDHLGRTSADEPLLQSDKRTSSRISNFLEKYWK